MCGICGVYDPDNPIDKGLLKRMCDVIIHRGPDDEGYFIDEKIGMGMRRLSIIDLETGYQPIQNEDGSIWVVYNGEIYNFKEIRSELERRGHRFYTKTDTEVIVHAYEEFGRDCVKEFNGMFAFALWDSNRNRLFLARDRLGIKPLHYTILNGRCVFGSEIKSILQDDSMNHSINIKALHYFMGFEFIPAPDTIFTEIKKLPPAHTLVIEGKRASLERYWDFSYLPSSKDEKYYEKKIIQSLSNSVEKRLVSDVPLGAFLSGGVDSSIVVALMSQLVEEPIKTFSIGFEDQSYSELGHANAVAERFETDHHEYVLEADVLDLLPEVVRFFDEPFADVSAIPTYLVSEVTKKDVTVALSGDGGDELFAGYDRYVADKLYQYYKILPHIIRLKTVPFFVGHLPQNREKKGRAAVVTRFVEGSLLPESGGSMRWQYFLKDEEEKKLFGGQLSKRDANPLQIVENLSKQVESWDALSRNTRTDLKLYMPDDILVKVDRMSMAHSLEARVPFLDHTFVEFAFTIPSSLKLRGISTKYILKKSMSHLLPREILKKKKSGFSPPLKNWLRYELGDMLEENLVGSEIISQYFNKEHIERMINKHRKGKKNYSHTLWCLLNFKLWHDIYMEDQHEAMVT